MGFACKCWLASHDVVSSPLTSAQRKWFTPVNWIDVTLLSVVGLFGLRGYFRGLFRELSSLVGLLAGFMIAVRYVDAVAARRSGRRILHLGCHRGDAAQPLSLPEQLARTRFASAYNRLQQRLIPDRRLLIVVS